MRALPWAVVLLLACGIQKDKGSETGDSGTSAEDTSIHSSGDTPTASTSGSTGSSGPAGESGEPTTGTTDMCAQFCDKLSACGLDGAFDGCPCLGDATAGPKCLAAWEKTTQCFEAATCAELNDDTSACWIDFMSAYEQCSAGEDGCETWILAGGPDDGTCTFGEDCIGAPTKEVHCDAVSCACTIDGMQVGTCPAEGVCGDLSAADSRIAACCG